MAQRLIDQLMELGCHVVGLRFCFFALALQTFLCFLKRFEYDCRILLI